MTDDRAGDASCYRFGRFVLDVHRLRLWCDDEVVSVPQKAFDVLAVLVARHGELVTKDQLLAEVWPQTTVEENNLPRQISTLRRILGDTREHHAFIATVPGAGYRFVAPVVVLVAAGRVDDVPLDVDVPALPDEASVEPFDDRAAAASLPASPIWRVWRSGLAATVALALVALPILGTSRAHQPVAPDARAVGGRLVRLTYGAGLQHQPAWSPDGRRVAFTSDAAGNADIWIQEVGQPLPVAVTTSSSTDWQPAWSPDGRWLAFRSERDGGGVYVVAASGGEPRRVTTFGFRPRWSPSGASLLLASSILDVSKSTMWIVPAAGGSPRVLRPDVLGAYASPHVAWRPGEDRLSVWGRREGQWTFSTFSPYDNEPPVVSAMPDDVRAAMQGTGLRLGAFSWAPAGTHLYFEGRAGDVANLWRVSIDPHTLGWLEGPERVTIGPGTDRDFAISPDGRRVAFSSVSERTRLWSIGIDAAGRFNGHAEAVTSGVAGEYDAAAPRDGDRLTFRTSRGGQQQLWERSVSDGAERILLAGPAAPSSSPRWSPDGRTIAYARRRDPAEGDAIGLFDAATGRERVVGVSPHWWLVPDDWSSDGSMLLAACRERGASVRTGFGTCLVTLGQGHGPVQVRTIAADPARSLICQRFSPDERWISFMAVDRRRPGVSTLYVMPSQGGPWIPVTDGRSYDDKPRWSADGRFLYYISDRGGPLDVWAQPFDPRAGAPDGPPVRVTSFDDPSRLISTDLGRVEIAVATDRIFLPMTEAAGEIWVLEVE
ncbi:MAG: hypothetical protein ABS36_15465 [Acidobacteria bacterium SCN 69-37]|nr:MAG: hypothetical protein ABS36_15465 [Acidobacteria bacterium SCN 69-37]